MKFICGILTLFMALGAGATANRIRATAPEPVKIKTEQSTPEGEMRERYKNMTKEEKKEFKKKCREKFGNMTEDEIKEFRMKRRAEYLRKHGKQEQEQKNEQTSAQLDERQSNKKREPIVLPYEE